ncbi:pentapeptide repeat protein, partial [Mycobacterium tuberculosis]
MTPFGQALPTVAGGGALVSAAAAQVTTRVFRNLGLANVGEGNVGNGNVGNFNLGS